MIKDGLEATISRTYCIGDLFRDPEIIDIDRPVKTMEEERDIADMNHLAKDNGFNVTQWEELEVVYEFSSIL